ncbi:MAG: hypothetical protein NTY88_03650 [Bacteroidetes bacterium]|nr:hypothetical protein [Bacteroidota bacterium]
MNQLRFLKRNEIDEAKWNFCIENSVNSLPYALSWYLDAVAENWDALVLNDYEFVMPLVWLRKFGVPCLYQPYYCQQLGVFGKTGDHKIQTEFLNYVTNKYLYTHINLNSSAKTVSELFHLLPKKNLLLDLSASASSIEKKYSDNHKRNISKATKAEMQFKEIASVKDFQNFYLQNINPAKENFKPQHEKIFKQLTETVLKKKAGKFFAISDKEDKLMAACLLLNHKNRIINIINTSSTEGKKNGASHFLFSQIIKELASKNLLLDFEGSSIAGVARFYAGFGASPETFYNLQTNLLKNITQRFS